MHDFDGLPSEYAHLLGLYLGDGWIGARPRGVYVLRVTLDAKYPDIVSECQRSILAVAGGQMASPVARPGCVNVTKHSKHWPCWLPQHGPGRKHERLIELTGWQKVLVERDPWLFLRGLVQSDGCRSMNTVRTRGKEYSYPRYAFSNYSDDIRELFGWACDLVGVDWRRMNRTNLSVARRASVALMDEYIGPKS